MAGNSRKNRIEKSIEYEEKYGNIPVDFNERLSYMYDLYNINEKKANEIINKRDRMMSSLYYTQFKVILFEEPEGSPRPRFRLVNRFNLLDQAKSNSNFVHVYSVNAKEDSMYMKRLMDTGLNELEHIIHTPCIVDYNIYMRTPSVFNITDTFLSELGLIRPICKPDWDNIGKKYSDMYNSNVWLDDTLVISGSVNKYYSILPRVEIDLRYLNTLYNKYQYNKISKKLDFETTYYGGK